jgi:hypothetical protein
VDVTCFKTVALYLPGGTEKTRENFSRSSRYPDNDLNTVCTEFKVEVLAALQQR